MATDFYDMDGNPISVQQWGRLRDGTGPHIGSTMVGHWWVSTVWLGLNHRVFGLGPPIIFETMVFYRGKDKVERPWLDEYMQRYATKEEALAGHEAVVSMVEVTENLTRSIVEEQFKQQ